MNTKCTKETKAFVYSVTCFSLLSFAKKFRLFCVFRVQIKFFVHSIFATSTKGATLNRAVRKGCHIGCYSILRSEGPTPIVLVFRCRTYSAPSPHPFTLTALSDCPIRCRTFGAPQITSVSEIICLICVQKKDKYIPHNHQGCGGFS